MNEDIREKLNRMEYHQSLLLQMITNSEDQFYKLVIEKQLNKADVEQFYTLCDKLSKELEKQKAEGFVHFDPLFDMFKLNLHPNLHAEEVIRACIVQKLYQPLMSQFKKYI